MHASVWVSKTQARNESDLVGLTCSLGNRRRLSRLCGVRLLCRARACMFGTDPSRGSRPSVEPESGQVGAS